jgi:hypothetical protein
MSGVACENRAAIYCLKDVKDELYTLKDAVELLRDDRKKKEDAVNELADFKDEFRIMKDVVALLRHDQEKKEKKKEKKVLEKRAKETEREERLFWLRVKAQSDQLIREGMDSS